MNANVHAMKTIMVYSEAGGVGKTTTAVSIATTAAEEGARVLLVDLDPRAAATKWTQAEPIEEGLHVGAILGAQGDPDGWAEELAVPSIWHKNLRIIPSDRNLSNRETDRDDYAELRLDIALQDVDADICIIDCANRQGGPLTLSALNASDTVVYAAIASDSGIDGVEGAQRSVKAFTRSRQRIGAPVTLNEVGVAVTRDGTGFMSLAETDSLEVIKTYSSLIEPLVPRRSIVPECRNAGEWYGNYRKGQDVRAAYAEIMRKVTQ